MTPVLHAPWFAFVSGTSSWSRMARVLEHTARAHCPGWGIHVDEVNALREYVHLNRSANAMKLAEWTKRVLAAPDGTDLLLMDSDMVVNHPLDIVWKQEFDIAFTVRPERMRGQTRIPLNGGFVALRASHIVREFFRKWQAISAEMTRDRGLHQRWRSRFGGQNQAALGAMFETLEFKRLHVNWLPCDRYNACEPEWEEHWQTAKTLHLKSGLRQAIFDPLAKPEPHLRPIADYWRALEQAALGVTCDSQAS